MPLVLVSVTYVGGDANPPAGASIDGPSTVSVGAGYKGTSYFNYVVRNSLGGTATGSLTVNVTGTKAQCGNGTN